MEISKQKGLNGSQLKLLAMVFMFIDHAAFILMRVPVETIAYRDYVYILMRAVGRIAFPIFGFLIAEGIIHTRNIKKYIGRLVLLSVISELPYDLYFNVAPENWQDSYNIFFTLILGACCLAFMKTVLDANLNKYIEFVFMVIIPLTFACMCNAMNFQYGGNGIAMMVIYYMFRRLNIKEPWPSILATAVLVPLGIIQIFSLPVALFLVRYNGQRGNMNKWIGYFFYPVHILILLIVYVIISLSSYLF